MNQMGTFRDAEQIPLLWINLRRANRRRARMDWALKQGEWKAHRLNAIDAEDRHEHFLPISNFLKAGTRIPGIYISDETEPKRMTSRAELACLASWKHALMKAKQIKSRSGWVLIMEDDLGASLAEPNAWRHSLIELIRYCPMHTLVIQLAPISATVRSQLAQKWKQTKGKCLAVKKEEIRSHGNGAVLLHQSAVDLLIDPLLWLCSHYKKNLHPLLHPWKIRPVADKWIYGALPEGCCQVATYPHFCLEAEDSALHTGHVKAFHKASREITLDIWKRDNRLGLIKSQQIWDQIVSTT